MNFCVRVDDVGWTPVAMQPEPMKRPDVGLTLAKRFHLAMGGVPWLAAVIPSTLDEAGLEWLASKPDGVTVALHGWNHERRLDSDSEFEGLGLNECLNRLRRGMDLLGLEVQHFVPPFNALTEDLVMACDILGLSIWGAMDQEPRPPGPLLRIPGPVFVPSWRRLYGATRVRMSPESPILVDEARALYEATGSAVLTMHLTWEAAHDSRLLGVQELAEIIRLRALPAGEYLSLWRRP